MDESRIAMMMEQQMSLLKAAKHRKGQKATNKATRQQLLMQFGMPVRISQIWDVADVEDANDNE